MREFVSDVPKKARSLSEELDAATYFYDAQYQKAIEHYDKAIAFNPKKSSVWNNRGQSKAKINCHKEAIADYDKAIELHPQYALLWFNRGLLQQSASPMLLLQRLMSVMERLFLSIFASILIILSPILLP